MPSTSNILTGQFVCWIQRTLVCWSALKRVALEAGSDRSVSLILKRQSQLEIIIRRFEYFRFTDALLTSMVDIVVICDYSRCGRYEIRFGSVLEQVCLQTQFLTAWRFRVKKWAKRFRTAIIILSRCLKLLLFMKDCTVFLWSDLVWRSPRLPLAPFPEFTPLVW